MVNKQIPAHLIEALKLLYRSKNQTWSPSEGCLVIGTKAETIDYFDQLEKQGLCQKAPDSSISRSTVSFKITQNGSKLIRSLLHNDHMGLSKDQIQFREATKGASIIVEGLGAIACMPSNDGHYRFKMLDADSSFISDTYIPRPEMERLIAGLTFMLAQEHENHMVERELDPLEEAAFGKMTDDEA